MVGPVYDEPSPAVLPMIDGLRRQGWLVTVRNSNGPVPSSSSWKRRGALLYRRVVTGNRGRRETPARHRLGVRSALVMPVS